MRQPVDFHIIDVDIEDATVSFHVTTHDNTLEIEDAYIQEVLRNPEGKMTIRRFAWNDPITADIAAQIAEQI